MSKFISSVVTFEGRQYVVIGVQERFEMFIGQEVGRNFITYVPFDIIK